jgi:1-acyl-sn-glycerol-3-phosphate acyltransferase
MSRMSFATQHREYIKAARKGRDFGYSLKTAAKAATLLGFLYEDWWKVALTGMQHLPKTGPVLIVGNAGGVVPWAGLMLLYGMMNCKEHPRRLNILADLDWIEDERLYNWLRELGFVSWSADNAKRLFAEGETVVVFPEGIPGAIKPFGERYRLRSFDWTKLMPAIDAKVPIIPLATIGPDESFPVGFNFELLAKFLSLPAFPVTATFPWLPFPTNVFSIPVKWKLHLLKPLDYAQPKDREQLQETAKRVALFAEGEVQAELNRILRTRIKPLF